MRKRNALLCMGVLLAALVLSWNLLKGYVASSDYSGITFAEEIAGHGGLYLEGDHILVSDSKTILVEGTTATITAPGKYELSGTLEDGQIIVDAGPEDAVTLELDDVSITCQHSAPIWVKSAGKVKLKLPEDTVNFLTDGEYYAFPEADNNQPNACVFSKADLTIKGKGSLTVTAHFRNGISTTDDLLIRNGIITVTAPNQALRGKDSVAMTDGVVTLTSGENAVQTSGGISMENCSVSLNAGHYALKAVSGIALADTAAVTVEAPFLFGCPGTITGTEQMYIPVEE
ncbi:MAG: carbohydrate-binding domain-containing protein [Oscillospiraceae bacterium]|nr:carbohydrate-binding domain-containing protein [Oscillospiraceae bacterium]